MFPTLIPQTPTEREHILSFGPKHLDDLSPKLAHLVETVSLESKGFQTGSRWEGPGGARQFFCRCNLAELRTEVHHGTGGRRILLARILNWNWPVFVQDVFPRQTWDTSCRLPNSDANWLGKFEGLPN